MEPEAKENKEEILSEDKTDIENSPELQEEKKDAEPKKKNGKKTKNSNEITIKKKEWEALNQTCEEYLDTAKRIKAEFENFKKRNETIRSDSYNDGKAAAALEFIPVLDNLERAESTFSDADEAQKQGIELIVKQMKDALGKLGVEEILAENEKFDPNLHQAVMQTEKTDELESGYISQVLMKGYRIGDKVLRYAMVAVVE